MPKQKIAMLTAGGLAPCLSAAVGGLIMDYTKLPPRPKSSAMSRAMPGCSRACRSR